MNAIYKFKLSIDPLIFYHRGILVMEPHSFIRHTLVMI